MFSLSKIMISQGENPKKTNRPIEKIQVYLTLKVTLCASVCDKVCDLIAVQYLF